MPTIREVARLAEVSVATVSKTLNKSGKVSDELQQRVVAAAQTLGYAPHASARSLRSGSTRIFGLLVADIANPFFLKLVETIEMNASAAGFSVILCNSGEDPEREQRNFQMLLSQRVDGIILIPTRESWPNRVAAMWSLPVPAILLDRVLDGLEIDSVTIDNHMAGGLAAEHLLKLRHQRVGIIMGSPDHQIARHRLDGFRDQFSKSGTPLDEQLIKKNLFTEEAAYAAVVELMASEAPPTAMFATNNHLALGLLRAVTQLGLVIPDDLSIVTVDDLPWAGGLLPGLTAVVQPSKAIAKAAVSTLLERVSKDKETKDGSPRSIVFEPTLLERGSTAPIGKSS